MQVEEFLEQGAKRFPDKTALVCGARRWTYRSLEEQCNQFAHTLIDEGVSRWDRVVVYLDNSLEAVVSVFSILKAGGAFVVINPTVKVDKLTFMLNNCRATALITDAKKLVSIRGCFSQTPHLKAVFVAGSGSPILAPEGKRFFPLDTILQQRNPAEHPPQKKCIDIDLAALIYTSGSTGRPKGVMLTHLNIVSAATSITTYLENTPHDIILDVLPLSFDYGLYQVLMAFKIGGTVVLEPSFSYPYAVIDKIVREKVTGFPVVPTIAAILLQLDLKKFDFSSLRYITNTAAALPTAHIRRLREAFPHVKIFSMYGLTECKRVSYLPPDQIDIRPGSVGRGMPNEEVYIVDDQGNRLGPGATGELVIRGSNVMKGYWELPEETEKILKPGLFPGEKVLHSGDLFRTDEEGYLYFVGRKDDIIKTRGEKVSPREVEEVIHSLEGVAAVAVVGIPDEILGQAIMAAVKLREGAKITPQDVLRHCAERLEDFMVPKVVEFRDSLPETTTGKVSRRELATLPGGER